LCRKQHTFESVLEKRNLVFNVSSNVKAWKKKVVESENPKGDSLEQGRDTPTSRLYLALRKYLA